MSDVVRADESGIGYLVNQTARALRSALGEELKHHGLSDADYIVLQIVVKASRVGGGVSVDAISEPNHLDAAETLEIANRLAQRGWLVPTVESSLSFAPAEQTLRVLPVIRDAARWMLERALNEFSHDEIDQLSWLLRRMLANLGHEGGTERS